MDEVAVDGWLVHLLVDGFQFRNRAEQFVDLRAPRGVNTTAIARLECLGTFQGLVEIGADFGIVDAEIEIVEPPRYAIGGTRLAGSSSGHRKAPTKSGKCLPAFCTTLPSRPLGGRLFLSHHADRQAVGLEQLFLINAVKDTPFG